MRASLFHLTVTRQHLLVQDMKEIGHFVGELVFNLVSIAAVTVAVLSALVYTLLIRRYRYWENRGIVGPKPAFFFGSLKDAIFLKSTEPQAVYSISSKYKDEKYVGIFHLWKPVVLFKDLDLVKKITEKDFDHFIDHPDIIGIEKTDSVLNSLFSMQGNIWKSRRIYFSKLFTPKKLREQTNELQHELKVLIEEMDANAKAGKDIDMFPALDRFVLYSFTSTMYGLNLSNDKERTDIFHKLTYFFMHPPVHSVVKFLCCGIYPKLFRFFKLKTIPTWHWDCSAKLTEELIYSREVSGTDRNDLLTMILKLMSHGTSDVRKTTFEETVGHVYAFLQAGTHTTQSTICHVLYRLAVHPDVQEKVRSEVDGVLKGSKVITYEDVKKMTYLDNVLLETQRINPLIGTLKRKCTKDYKVDDKLTIPKSMDVYIDAVYIQNDPKYFPEPEKFKPERWSNGESEPSAFMAFGKGPRICIGKRFAEIEIKMAVASFVSRYIILPSEKMKPVKFNPQTLFITNIPTDGIWIKLKFRE